MVPYDTYRIYQIERAKSPAEVRRADEQAAQLAPLSPRCFVASPGRCAPCPRLHSAGSSAPASPARPDQPALAGSKAAEDPKRDAVPGLA